MRAIDIAASIAILIVLSPLLIPVLLLVWWQDGHSPFYVAARVGVGGKEFRMFKLRSMVKNADRTGVDSTGANDPRITPVGRLIRRYKLDEIPQLWNVLKGEMSLVGPRPNVKRETDLYTVAERRLLDLPPGITDFASIVYADEGEILKHEPDPDIAYNQLIRPRKSALGLFYVEHRSLSLNLRLCALTAVALVSRQRALVGVANLLRRLDASADLIAAASRSTPLDPIPPPGATTVVTSRKINAA